MTYEKDSSGNLGWFLFGAALGAAVAFLTTPRSGRETRDLLSERSGDVAKRAQEWAGEAQSHAGEWLGKRGGQVGGASPRALEASRGREGSDARRDQEVVHLGPWLRSSCPIPTS